MEQILQESILTSVKKLLGVTEECEEFDPDILMNINAAIFTLRQLGVGPKEGFTVTNKEQTFQEYIGDDVLNIPQVKMYLYYKVRLGWDTPTSSFVLENIKQEIAEAEWRMREQVELKGVL